jgi:hypothetical protein
MKVLFLLFLVFFLISCKKEKSFADDINLEYSKNEKLSFQKFNEGVGESETGLIYIGKDTSMINVKYFKTLLPPPSFDHKKTQKDFEREKILSQYFYPRFERIKLSRKPVVFDSIDKKDLQVIVKIQDTIPKYAYNYETGKLKKYKSFPVFIKNISNRKLILPEFKNFPLSLFNRKNEWQIIWNENPFICGNGRWNYIYWELKPDEIMIFSVNFLSGKDKGKFKIPIWNLSSDSFMMNYDKKVVEQQRSYQVQK